MRGILAGRAGERCSSLRRADRDTRAPAPLARSRRVQLRGGASTATRLLPTTMNVPIDIVPGRGAERPAWGRRKLGGGGSCRSLQCLRLQRRTVQPPAARDSAGGRRAAAANRVGLTLGLAARPRFTCHASQHTTSRNSSARKRAVPTNAGPRRPQPVLGRTTERYTSVQESPSFFRRTARRNANAPAIDRAIAMLAAIPS
jgi:hypothetical protein